MHVEDIILGFSSASSLWLVHYGEPHVYLQLDKTNISCFFDPLIEHAIKDDICIDVPELKDLGAVYRITRAEMKYQVSSLAHQLPGLGLQKG